MNLLKHETCGVGRRTIINLLTPGMREVAEKYGKKLTEEDIHAIFNKYSIEELFRNDSYDKIKNSVKKYIDNKYNPHKKGQRWY